MADNKNPITDGLKKLLLASVGAVALTAEKADELVGTLVEKGEPTRNTKMAQRLLRIWMIL